MTLEIPQLHIKNMVCPRCVMVVRQAFEQIGVEPISVDLGEVKLKKELSGDELKQLDDLLAKNGFERIDDRKVQLLEKIKTLVIDTIHHRDPYDTHIQWSAYLSDQLHYDYNYLSSLFSGMAGITLEQYIIRQKMEKVKEFLFYDELSVKEIAYKMGFSSVAHLSNQFKKIIGLSPTEFKKSIQQTQSRKPLDQII
ncbi:AraC family transcriptional regulator [Marinoscillum sp. 108]|uniref:AraC family transcriptional regulator n=1 Tax=Marinoscillum sp. 108 TaxID=2653151 RepID=UPI0012EF3023|nr:helix-turn-helix domain-containing protein [Marinoscillum sp. 108]VXD13683.1 Helix-turn-helix domain-containing protein [Marinoscillum sp. 108]